MSATVSIPESPSYKYTGADHACVCCGREVKNPKFFLEVVNGGSSAAMPGTADVSDPGYIGGLPIGPDCLRRFSEYDRTSKPCHFRLSHETLD